MACSEHARLEERSKFDQSMPAAVFVMLWSVQRSVGTRHRHDHESTCASCLGRKPACTDQDPAATTSQSTRLSSQACTLSWVVFHVTCSMSKPVMPAACAKCCNAGSRLCAHFNTATHAWGSPASAATLNTATPVAANSARVSAGSTGERPVSTRQRQPAATSCLAYSNPRPCMTRQVNQLHALSTSKNGEHRPVAVSGSQLPGILSPFIDALHFPAVGP